MTIHTKETTPIVKYAPSGEIIFELTGRQPEIGSTQLHSVAHVTIPVGMSSYAHYHKKMEETYYMLSGKALIILDGVTTELLPGQACLIMPPKVHQIVNASDEKSLEFLCICGPSFDAEDMHFV